MRTLSKTFLKGLAAVLPITITLYLLFWLGKLAESMLGGLLEWLLPEGLYWPGMGLLIGCALVLLAGILIDRLRSITLFRWWEHTLNRVPLVKTIYGAIKDFMRLFEGPEQRRFNQVVVVTLPHTDYRLLGFVTREDFATLPAALGGTDTVAVYLPLSYQIGGFTVMMPRAQLQGIEMSVPDAMRYTLTAGVSTAQSAVNGEKPFN